MRRLYENGRVRKPAGSGSENQNETYALYQGQGGGVIPRDETKNSARRRASQEDDGRENAQGSEAENAGWLQGRTAELKLCGREIAIDGGLVGTTSHRCTK